MHDNPCRYLPDRRDRDLRRLDDGVAGSFGERDELADLHLYRHVPEQRRPGREDRLDRARHRAGGQEPAAGAEPAADDGSDDRDVRIVWVEPVIAPTIRNRLPEQNLRQSVEATIGPGKTANVSGSFFVTLGTLSKEEIDRLGPFVLGFRVVSDQIVPVPT